VKRRTPTVSLAYARSLIDYLRTCGVDPASILPAHEVAAIEKSDVDSTDSLSHWLGLLAKAVRANADPEMPLKVGASFKIRHLGLAGHVLMSCRTLDEVGKQARRYLVLLGDVGRPRVVRRGRTSELRLDWRHGEAPAPIQQIFIAAAASLGRWLTARPDLVFDAHLQFQRPRSVAEYTRLLGGKIAFGQSATKLVFPTAYLALPVASSNPAAMRIMEAHARALLRDARKHVPAGGANVAETELVAAVKAAVNQGLSLGRVALADVAAILELSTRSLQRRLSRAGANFHDILEEARRSHAEAFLSRDPPVSLAEIAFMLGYTEQSTFQQAFKRWTGLTPGEFRAHHAAGVSKGRSAAPRRRTSAP
jgi:AraC-like DNA-binding protein